MKYIKKLLINNQEFELINEEINLHLNWIGKASFVVISSEQLVGLVELKIGLTNSEYLNSYFKGVVDSCIEVAKGEWQIIAREYTGALDLEYAIAMRHVTLKEVLAKISSVSGVKFVCPDKDYSKLIVPFFYHTGNCNQQVSSLGEAFSIPDYVWCQQGDGTCYVGSYQDSFWQDKLINVQAHQVKSINGKSLVMPVLPMLRPGVSINQNRIEHLTMSGTQMVVKW